MPPAELEWSRRLGHVLQEIRQHAPDVLALQEVDRLSDFLGPLSQLGWVRWLQLMAAWTDGLCDLAVSCHDCYVEGRIMRSAAEICRALPQV